MSASWQRLPFFAVGFFSIQGLRKLISLYPALIGAAVTVNHLNLAAMEIAFYIGCVILLIVLSAVLRWLNFFYWQEQSKISIRSGVFNKERLELDFSRIQSVSIKEPFYFRPFDRVILAMDSAGSSQNEVNIAALKRLDAYGMKRAIESVGAEVSARAGGDDASPEAAAQGAESLATNERLLLTRDMSDIIIHGITRNRALIFIALAWPFLEHLESRIYSAFQTMGFDINGWIDAQSSATLVIVVIVLILIFFLFITALSVLGSIFALANFRLTYGNEGYQRNSGLLNKHEMKVKASRIQSLVYEKNWLDRLFDRGVMIMEPFASGANQNAMDAMMQKILVPSLRDEEFDSLASHVWPQMSLRYDNFKAISRFYILRNFFNFGGLIGLGLIVFAYASGQPQVLGLIFLLPLMLPLLYLRWRRFGWQLSGDFVILRRGFIGHTYMCFPRYKIQQVQYHQSVMLERRGLASISLVLASRRVTLPFICESDARKIVDQALADAEFSGRSWM